MTKTKFTVCSALAPFGTSVFTEMTALSTRHGAVNLSQGFPDFDGPNELLQVAAKAILSGPNQYVASEGTKALRQAIAEKIARFYDISANPQTEITVTSGATEGLTASLLAIVEPDDEVILFEPCYDLYPPMVARAGAKAIYVSLEPPDFAIPFEALERAFGSRTKAIVINNPQNPSGKVFSREELERIGALCQKHDVVAIGDEVYEHLVYDEHKHITLRQIESLEDRAIVVSSTAKTFSLTGWKVGYAVAPESLSRAVRMSHQFLTFCTPGVFQKAMTLAMRLDDEYYECFLSEYTRRRQRLCDGLADIGFKVLRPRGTYYASIDISELDFEDDLSFCRQMTEEARVAAIPSSYFWHNRRGGRHLVRLCFCKQDKTIDEALMRLKRWRR